MNIRMFEVCALSSTYILLKILCMFILTTNDKHFVDIPGYIPTCLHVAVMEVAYTTVN